MLAAAEPQIIGASTSVPADLRTKPQTKFHFQMPNPKHWTLFGWPISFIKKSKEEIFIFKGMNEKIPTLDQENFSNKIGFRMDFSRSEFHLKYYSIKDVTAMLGGILKIFTGSLAEIGIVMTLVFFVWFMVKVTQSFNEDL